MNDEKNLNMSDEKNSNMSDEKISNINTSLMVNIAGIDMKNPVMTASGTFGFGREYSDYMDLNRLGAIVVKGLTLKPRQGNKPPRIAETPAGILNSVGFQNPGVEAFIQEELPFLKQFDVPVIANIAGNTIEEYCEMAEILSGTDIAGIELNISCPNIREGGIAFGVSCDAVSSITSQVRERCRKPLIVKLSPNVTDIREIALSAEAAGADALSLINTLLGMAIDIHRRKPILANNTGGLSGPAVKPVAVRMVWQVTQAVRIPVIGMGGIMTGEDAVEFMLAGASAVAVGTANFINPASCIDIVNGIQCYLYRYNYGSVKHIIGKVEVN